MGTQFILSQLALMAEINVTTLNLEAVTVNNDGINKFITINGNRSSLLFEYNQKAVITSYKIDQKEILDIAANGIYSALKHSGAWTTSLSLASSPIVNVIGSSVTATFSTSLADEIWTLNAFDSSIQFQMVRKYKSALTLDEQGTPLMNFQKDIFENMRWLGDGGNFPLGGKASNQDFWFGTNSGTSVRASKEQISYVLLGNESNHVALKINGSSNYEHLSRGAATEVYRFDLNGNKILRLGVNLAANNLEYVSRSNNPQGYWR